MFPTDAGVMYSPETKVLQDVLEAALVKIRHPHIRVHDLRHTFASHFVMSGGDIFTLQHPRALDPRHHQRDLRPPVAGPHGERRRPCLVRGPGAGGGRHPVRPRGRRVKERQARSSGWEPSDQLADAVEHAGHLVGRMVFLEVWLSVGGVVSEL